MILVDCDLRHPRVHEFFGLSNKSGFTSALLGTDTLAEAIQPVEGYPSLALLASGPPPPNQSELLSFHQTRELLDTLRSRCDLLLIDSPPVLPVTDPLVLSVMADAALPSSSPRTGRPSGPCAAPSSSSPRSTRRSKAPCSTMSVPNALTRTATRRATTTAAVDPRGRNRLPMAASQEAASEPTPDRGDTVTLSKHPVSSASIEYATTSVTDSRANLSMTCRILTLSHRGGGARCDAVAGRRAHARKKRRARRSRTEVSSGECDAPKSRPRGEIEASGPKEIHHA